MSRWFRFYDDAINDPKILKLPEASRWHWAALLCIASKHDGVLPPTDDIAISLRVKTSAAAAIIAGLKIAGLLDLVDGRYVPHNWDGRQFKSDTSSDRVKRYRERQRNVTETVTRPVTVTPCSVSVSDSVSISISEKEKAYGIEVKSDFDAFWEVWPNKVGKPAALKAYISAIKRGVLHTDVVAGVWAYISAKPPDRPWLNPATFINQNRWEDRPAPIAKPLTEFQRKQQETNDVRAMLRNARESLGSGGTLDRLLPDHNRERPESLRGGAGSTLFALPGASGSGGH